LTAKHALSTKCDDRLAAKIAQRRALMEESRQSRRQTIAAEAVERRALRQLLENWKCPTVAMAEGALAEIARLRKRLAEMLPAGR
jgi:hypothetical protein